MADGCNLYLSRKDLEQIKSSIDQGDMEQACSTVDMLMNDEFSQRMVERVSYPLRDPTHPAHEVFSKYVLRNVVGNESIPSEYKEKLPAAIAKIATITPDALGLVKPARLRGLRAGAIDDSGKLGHRTKGDAFAYELLGTGTLISIGSIASDTGQGLKIDGATDRVDLGIKLQASFAGTETVLPGQPRRGTVEADLFISRSAHFLSDTKYIGVDFKHSRSGGTYSGEIETEQLKGIKVAIKTGQIDEFHFVTNGRFSQSVKDHVAELNDELLDAGLSENFIALHEKVRP